MLWRPARVPVGGALSRKSRIGSLSRLRTRVLSREPPCPLLFGEREVGFLLSKSMGIDPKRERRVRMAELIGYSANVLARVKREGRPRMTGVVDAKRTHAERLSTSTDAVPDKSSVFMMHFRSPCTLLISFSFRDARQYMVIP